MEVLQHLHGELAGGQKNEREYGSLGAARAGDGYLLEAFDHGDEEAQGLAGAGGGGGEDVVAFKRGRNGSGLHRGGGDEAGGGEARLQRVRDVEVGEGELGGGFGGCGDVTGDLEWFWIEDRFKRKRGQGFPLRW